MEALAFATSLRNLDLARQAIELFPAFGWPLAALRYLVPVFGSATPGSVNWPGLGRRTSIGQPLGARSRLPVQPDVPERPLERRSVVKT